MRNFYILGAGIGGLSIAHLLAQKYPSATIRVFEKNNIIGGMARSTRNEHGKFQEYCWHAFGTKYNNLLKLLKDAKVIQNLVPVNKYVYDSENLHEYTEYGRNFLGTNIFQIKAAFEQQGITFSYKDLIELLRIYAQIQHIPFINKIDYDKEDEITWQDFISNIQHPKLKKWLIGFTSIYLGMEASCVSAGTILNVARSSTGGNDKYDFLIPNGPINEVILDPWMEYLKKEYNVMFYLNTPIIKLISHNNKIISIQTSSNSYKLLSNLDVVINSLDVGGWTHLINNIPINNVIYQQYIKKWMKLKIKSLQIQSQVLFELNEFLEWNSNQGIILTFMESPWCLMIRVETNIWKKTEGELLSCGIGRWDVESELFGKTACNLDPQELAAECWHQLCKYGKNIFTKTHIVKGKYSNKTIAEIGYKETRFWPYNYINKKITTDEPKFSNNINCYNLRPFPKDEYFTNVYHSNAYTRQKNYNYKNPDLFCMENAATIATVASKLI